MKTFFVTSDVHDNYSLLLNCLNNNGFDSNNKEHILLICGDAFIYGNESGKLLEFLLKLKKDNRLIFVFGNHDLDLLNNINNGLLKNRNITCVKNIVKYFKNIDTDNNDVLIKESYELGLYELLNSMVPYYEHDKYIFVHGFIPTRNKTYIPDWRNLSIDKFKSSTIRDGMALSMKEKISEDNKIIVFGHYAASRCRLMENATKVDWENKKYKNFNKVPNEWNRTYYGKTFIALDSRNRVTNFINILKI